MEHATLSVDSGSCGRHSVRARELAPQHKRVRQLPHRCAAALLRINAQKKAMSLGQLRVRLAARRRKDIPRAQDQLLDGRQWPVARITLPHAAHRCPEIASLEAHAQQGATHANNTSLRSHRRNILIWSIICTAVLRPTLRISNI